MISLEEFPMVYAQMDPITNPGLITAKPRRRRACQFCGCKNREGPPGPDFARVIRFAVQTLEQQLGIDHIGKTPADARRRRTFH
jgi:hypothetical protein